MPARRPCRSRSVRPCAAAAASVGQSAAAPALRAWPVTKITPCAWSRCVSGTPSDVAAASPTVMPLTTSTSMPCARRCSASSPPRPKTNGSPPFSRTTLLAFQRLADHQLLDEGLRRARAAAALADVDDARPRRDAVSASEHRVARPGRRPAARSRRGSRAAPCRVSSSGSPGPAPTNAQTLPMRCATAAKHVHVARAAHALFSSTASASWRAHGAATRPAASAAPGAGFSPLTTDWMYSAVVAASLRRAAAPAARSARLLARRSTDRARDAPCM